MTKTDGLDRTAWRNVIGRLPLRVRPRSMRRFWLFSLLSILGASTCAATDVGIFQRADCSTLIAETSKTFCFDQTSNTLKAWTGSAWVGIQNVDSALGIVNVKDLGAKGDGSTDDTAALRAAFADGRTVYLPPGTYIVGTLDSYENFLYLTNLNDLHIFGAGMGRSIIKVKNSAGAYRWIFNVTLASNNNPKKFVIRDLTIDGNIVNNPIVDAREINNHWRKSIEIGAGNNSTGYVSVERVEFKNMSSMNTIVAGGPGSMSVVIKDNLFHHIGTDPNNVPHDHSTLYIQVEHATIESNTFISTGADDNGTETAIETHGGKQKVTGNLIVNYVGGIIITGVSELDSTDVVVTNNRIEGAVRGITMWPQKYGSHTGGFGLNGALIANNVIHVTQSVYTKNHVYPATGIDLYPNRDLDAKNITIAANIIRFDLESVSRAVSSPTDSAGIRFWGTETDRGLTAHTISDVVIDGNTIENAPGAGIRLSENLRNVLVTNNLLRNCGSGKQAGSAGFPIWVYRGSINGLKIAGNTIVDDLSTTRVYGGIAATAYGPGLPMSNVELLDNSIYVAGISRAAYLTDYWVENAWVHPLIRGTLSGTVDIDFSRYLPGNVKAGSRLVDSRNNIEFMTTAIGTSWVSRDWGTAPPTSEKWRTGDIRYNSSPSEQGTAGSMYVIHGWTCVSGGNPGRWVEMRSLTGH